MIFQDIQSMDENRSWHSTFQQLNLKAKEKAGSQKIGKSAENRIYNRYRDVVPYDHSLVVLRNSDTEYINANFVKVSSINKEYILTQGPLPNTMQHFWEMVWEQNTYSIVMLNRVIEKNQLKCHQYWPLSGSMTAGDIEITLKAEEDFHEYVVRDLELHHIEEDKKRIIHHFHYVVWPDFGVPRSPQAFLKYLLHVRDYQASIAGVGPPVIHCSAGIGRSGTFALIDAALTEIQENDDMMTYDVKRVLMEMRTYRAGLIQTMEQLRFSYIAILEGANQVAPEAYGTAYWKMAEQEKENDDEDNGGCESDEEDLHGKRKEKTEVIGEEEGEPKEKQARKPLPEKEPGMDDNVKQGTDYQAVTQSQIETVINDTQYSHVTSDDTRQEEFRAPEDFGEQHNHYREDDSQNTTDNDSALGSDQSREMSSTERRTTDSSSESDITRDEDIDSDEINGENSDDQLDIPQNKGDFQHVNLEKEKEVNDREMDRGGTENNEMEREEIRTTWFSSNHSSSKINDDELNDRHDRASEDDIPSSSSGYFPPDYTPSNDDSTTSLIANTSGSMEKVVDRWQSGESHENLTVSSTSDDQLEPRPKRSAMRTNSSEGKRKSVSFVEENGTVEYCSRDFEEHEDNNERSHVRKRNIEERKQKLSEKVDDIKKRMKDSEHESLFSGKTLITAGLVFAAAMAGVAFFYYQYSQS